MQLQTLKWKSCALGVAVAIALLGWGAPLAAQGTFWTPQAVLKDMFAASTRVSYVEVPMAVAGPTLAAALGYIPPKSKYTVFIGRSGDKIDGYAVLDEERGQHLPIRFAVQLSPVGQVVRTEVMAYAEAYGEEIREARFRAQFVGKQAQDPLRLGDDVVAISGATISSRSMTVAVKRATALVAWVRTHPLP